MNDRGLTLSVAYMQSALNVVADILSRPNRPSPTNKIVTKAVISGLHVSLLGPSSREFIYNQSELQITDLREPATGSTGICHGHHVRRLVRHVCLRVPFVSFAAQGHPETGPNPVQTDFGHALLSSNDGVTLAMPKPVELSKHSDVVSQVEKWHGLYGGAFLQGNGSVQECSHSV